MAYSRHLRVARSGQLAAAQASVCVSVPGLPSATCWARSSSRVAVTPQYFRMLAPTSERRAERDRVASRAEQDLAERDRVAGEVRALAPRWRFLREGAGVWVRRHGYRTPADSASRNYSPHETQPSPRSPTSGERRPNPRSLCGNGSASSVEVSPCPRHTERHPPAKGENRIVKNAPRR